MKFNDHPVITCNRCELSNSRARTHPYTSPLLVLRPYVLENANPRQNEYEWDTCGIK